MNKNKIVLGGVVLGAILIFSGCGPNLGEKIGETIVEKAVESQTGGKVDINSEKGTMNISTGQGDVSVSGDGTAALNKDFPSDVYIAPDAKIIMSFANGENKSYSVAYATNMKMDEVYAKYKEELAAKGWTADTQIDLNTEDSKTIIYKKGTRSLTVLIGLSQDEQFAGMTHVQVIGAEDSSSR